jgi:hypothetical protein
VVPWLCQHHQQQLLQPLPRLLHYWPAALSPDACHHLLLWVLSLLLHQRQPRQRALQLHRHHQQSQ